MFTDNARLTYSINGRRVTIMDNINQNMFVRNVDSYAECKTLDASIVFSHVQLLMRALVGKKVTWLMYKPFTNAKGTETTKIMEFDNGYNFIVEGKCGELKGDVLYGERGFDVTKLLQDVNFAYSMLQGESRMLRPKYDIMRFVSDADIYIMKHAEDVMIIKPTNVSSNTVKNCMLNSEIYAELRYVIDVKDETFQFFDGDTVVFEGPMDFSVRTYLLEKKSTDAIVKEIIEEEEEE